MTCWGWHRSCAACESEMRMLLGREGGRSSAAHHAVDLRLVEGVGGAVDDRRGDIDEAMQLAGDRRDARLQRGLLAGLDQDADARHGQIGRASCRERECQYV